MRHKPGPKIDPNIGPLRRRTVLIDDLAERQLLALGKNNLSSGVRSAARIAFAKYQATPDEVTPPSTKTAPPDAPQPQPEAGPPSRSAAPRA